MAKITLIAAGAGLALASAGFSANAQTVDNNFSRDRGVSVTDRQHPEYAPLGIHAGAFMINPSVGVGLGYNDNIYYDDANKTSSSFIEISPDVKGATTWSRHQLSFDVGAASDSFSSASSENRTAWHAGVDGRFDISAFSNLTGGLSHSRNYESRASFSSDTRAVKPVPIDTDAEYANLTLVGNRLKFVGGLRNQTDKYKNVASVAGGELDESGRNLKTTVETGRLDYAISPSVSVFGYVEANQRRYDISSLRNSDGSILALGTSFELGGLARGEVQVGTIRQDYKNFTNGKLSSGYGHAKVEWFPTQITTVTARYDRSYYENPTVSGPATAVLSSDAGLSVDHELLRNLILSAAVDHNTYDFRGGNRNDKSNTIALSGRYLMNRRMTLVAKYSHQNYDSSGSAAGRAFTDNAAIVSIVFAY